MPEAERIERSAALDFQRAAPEVLAAARGIAAVEVGGVACTVVASEPELTAANRAIGVDERTAGTVLDAVEAYFAGHRVRFCIGGDVPALAARGYVPGGAAALFERGVEPFEAPAGTLAVTEAEASEEFGAICATASGLPGVFAEWIGALPGRAGWHCFLALDGARAVATGALHADGALGWLGFGATLAADRRRGAQQALLAARIARALELGLTRLVTETDASPAGGSYRNLERAGFALARVRPTWLSPCGNPPAQVQ